MADQLTFLDKDFAAAFTADDRAQRIQIGKTACLLAMVLSLAGTTLDYFIYPQEVGLFIELRLICSVVAGFLFYIHTTKVGQKYYRFLGVPIALNPIFFLGWIILETPDPASSPYYAGWMLIIMAASLVIRWNVRETLVTVGFIFIIYGLICFWKGTRAEMPVMFNNFFFLWSTGIIVTVGNHFATKFRIREFALRYQLDKNKRELEETNRKLVELDRLKSRFFANISHELRTPLTLLLAPLESLMQRFENSFDDNSRNLLITMHSNGMRLLKLINDLLDLIRLEAGRMDIKQEPVVVADFIKGLVSAVRPVAENKRISLQASIDPEVGAMLTDRDKLEKILLNLLFNAIKFTPADGRVWLSGEKQNDHFILTVRDNGVGISEKNLDFVFDRFWQADSSSRRRFQGVGIGLALVKELAEMMGGGVTVQSTEGKGTTFAVHLPFKKAPMPSSRQDAGSPSATDGAKASDEWLAGLYRRAEFFPAASARRGAARSARRTGTRPSVLIADDEPDMRHFLRSELEEQYDLIEAVNGLEALEKAEEFSPDIILLDMMMPEMDGLEACRELRKRPSTLNIPVILLTARADEETKFDALEIGANDFLAKPFSSTELQARIKNLIESHHYQRKLSKQNVALTSAIEQIKETEMQLVQSEKLASLGRLSAGIIHEINNPLNFSLTGLFALRNKSKQLAPEQRAEYEEILNDVEEGIKRVRNIVSDLRTFTHPGGGGGEIVEVEDALDAALRFLAGEWKGKVHIEQHLAPQQTVWANRNKLIHVLVNLLQNSIDAMEDKKFEDGEQRAIWIEGRVEGGRSFIVVRDNGPGIDPKVMDKIFDPFFTTKEVGKGMGLGLSICYRILQGYDGKISVKSEFGQGCEFTIELLTKEKPAELETQHGEPLRL